MVVVCRFHLFEILLYTMCVVFQIADTAVAFVEYAFCQRLRCVMITGVSTVSMVNTAAHTYYAFILHRLNEEV